MSRDPDQRSQPLQRKVLAIGVVRCVHLHRQAQREQFALHGRQPFHARAKDRHLRPVPRAYSLRTELVQPGREVFHLAGGTRGGRDFSLGIHLRLGGAKPAYDLARSHIRARHETLEARLAKRVVQHGRKDAIDEVDDRRVAAKGDLKNAARAARLDRDFVVNVTVAAQVGTWRVDGLLKITDDGEALVLSLRLVAAKPGNPP